MLDLFALAEAWDLTVEFYPLVGRNGEYRHDLKRIRLRAGMSERLARWTLAHELGHARFAHVLTMFGRHDPKQERQASEWAALLLIDVERFREVEALRDGHVPSMAHDLGVVADGVRAFQGLLNRIGDTVYLEAGMGVGNWTARLQTA